jgi:hypothetical protein
MALFSRKSGIAENRIENSGRWPVRVTRFQLIDNYEFPATNFPEIFFVQKGRFLHETGAGSQAVREGVAMMVNPGQRHTVKQPEEVVLTRVRFLPEWLTREYDLIIRSPNLLSLFFDQSWFRYPRDENLHVFTTRGEGAARIVTRVSILKLMMLLADEHHRFWRGVSEVELLPEAAHALDQIEGGILRAGAFDPAAMPRGGFEKRAIEKAFNELTGMTMSDYAHRRRVFHAAFRLLTTREDPRRISRALGWASTGEFTNQFASVFDIPPAVYREKFGLPAEEKAPDEKAEQDER